MRALHRLALLLVLGLSLAAPAAAVPAGSARLTPVVRVVQAAAPAVVNITSSRTAERGLRAF